MTTVRSSIDTSHDGAFGIRSENQLAHDIKIGAAGELFVDSALYIPSAVLELMNS